MLPRISGRVGRLQCNGDAAGSGGGALRLVRACGVAVAVEGEAGYDRRSISIIDNPDRSLMDRLPVSEFQILLALLEQPMHGAAVRNEVASRTGGAVLLGPGTLYTSVKRLLSRGWIVEVPGEGTDVRRVYRLTRDGRAAAAAEAERLEQDLAHARRHRLLGRLRPS